MPTIPERCGQRPRLRPRKSLGQAFLVSSRTAHALVAALAAGPSDTVLEIGPGKGALTFRLAGRVRRLVAVELDARLVRRLRQLLDPTVEVVEADFLKYDLSTLGQARVIGNLPYNISSQILFRLLDNTRYWTTAVLTTQREFAARVLAGAGSRDYAPLSVFVEMVCNREKLFDIPPKCFRPSPKVVSTALRLSVRESPRYMPDDTRLFRHVVKSAFAHRRKTLANNIAAGLGLSKDEAVGLLARAGIEPEARAEQVDLAGFAALYEAFRRER